MMTVHIWTRLTVAALVLAAVDASAQTIDAKAGLWETTTTTTMSGVPAMPDMSQMTPEDRAQLEAMLKEQFSGAPRVHTDRSCLTQEDLAEDPFVNTDDDDSEKCVSHVTERSRNALAGSRECTGDGYTSAMDFKLKMTSREAGTMSAMLVRTEGGQESTVKVDATMRWLGADCPDGE